MPASSGIPENSPRSQPLESSLGIHQVLKDESPSKRHLGSSVDEPEQSTSRKSKRRSDVSVVNRPKSYSLASRTTVGSNMQDTHHREHGDVRTLPPWICSFEDSEGENDGDFTTSRATDILLKSPPHAHSAEHHYTLTMPERRRSQDGYFDSYDDNSQQNAAKSPEKGFWGGSREPDKGRKWDHVRQGEPVIVQAKAITDRAGFPQISSPWKTFVRSSMYGPSPNEDGKRVDPSFLDEQTPGYVQPWRGDVKGEDPEKALGLTHRKIRRTIWYQRIQHVIMMHPLVPLIFRVIVLTTSTLALGLSASIYQLTRYSPFPQTPSTIMAVVVDVMAMPYIGYVTWDEYTGKPLGLRSPKAKMRLVLLDLFFIVFESANLALALGSLVDENGSCERGRYGNDYSICSRLQTLCAFLFIALVAWISTFSVSILRLVHRVGGGRDGIE